MARRSYKFTDKKHTKQGLLSVACGGGALILTAVSLSLAFRMAGQAGSVVGLLGIFAMMASAAGFVLAIRGFQEEDRLHDLLPGGRGAGRLAVHSVGGRMRDWDVAIPGYKGRNPHELAHKWMEDLGTRNGMSIKVGWKSHDI